MLKHMKNLHIIKNLNKTYSNRGDKMKRNNIIMALTLTSLALLFSETECGCHVMETIKEKM